MWGIPIPFTPWKITISGQWALSLPLEKMLVSQRAINEQMRINPLWRRSLLYSYQSKLMDYSLYDWDLRHERVKDPVKYQWWSFFSKKVNSQWPLTIFEKRSIRDIWQRSKCVTEDCFCGTSRFYGLAKIKCFII